MDIQPYIDYLWKYVESVPCDSVYSGDCTGCNLSEAVGRIIEQLNSLK